MARTIKDLMDLVMRYADSRANDLKLRDEVSDGTMYMQLQLHAEITRTLAELEEAKRVAARLEQHVCALESELEEAKQVAARLVIRAKAAEQTLRAYQSWPDDTEKIEIAEGLVEKLRAERDELAAALEPFAKHAEKVDADDETCGHIPDDCGADGTVPPARIPTMGDCRRARAALAKAKP